MTEGWDATGLLEPLWGRVGGRDKLAALTGIQGGTLSGYNTGRLKLGATNATKIAAALDVSLFDLGAPAAQADAASLALLDRLQELEAENAVRHQETQVLERLVRQLTGRVDRLEARVSKGQVTG